MNAPAGSHLGPQGPLSHRLLDFQRGRQHMAEEAVLIMHLMNLYSQLFFAPLQTAHLEGIFCRPLRLHASRTKKKSAVAHWQAPAR